MLDAASSWKVRRDPYLGPLAARLGDDAAFRAGFFLDADDEDAPLDDVDWRSTPLPRLRGAEGARPVVLLATGAFCPVHGGHLAMMEHARRAVEAAGLTVLGGYLSPGHDLYIEEKCGPAAIPASERLRQCAAAAAGTTWLSVDPWEALHRRVAVNYTDVTARLRSYLRAHVDPRVDVLYVCGGDNARFAHAFVEDGGCVVVGRPGAHRESSSVQAELVQNARIIFCEGDHPAASRAMRSALWTRPEKRRIVVRIEDARAVRTLGLSPSHFEAFQRELVALFAAYVDVRTVPLGPPARETGVISLDPMMPAAWNLAISRCFALGGYQSLGHVARPGAAPLDAQVAAIPEGEWHLRDDDRMTGGTLAAVRAMLPAKVRIVGTRLAIEHDDDEDVVDSRDFLLGADDGGLVVELPSGAVGRAPYMLPYVDPAVRACIPPAAVHAFSREVWSLNEQTLRQSSLRVRDLPPFTRALLTWFDDDSSLAAVCRWHVDGVDGVVSRGR